MPPRGPSSRCTCCGSSSSRSENGGATVVGMMPGLNGPVTGDGWDDAMRDPGDQALPTGPGRVSHWEAVLVLTCYLEDGSPSRVVTVTATDDRPLRAAVRCMIDAPGDLS